MEEKTNDTKINKCEDQVLLLEANLSAYEEKLLLNVQQVAKQLIEYSTDDSARYLQQLEEIEREELKHQTSYYQEYEKLITEKRKWNKRIMTLLRNDFRNQNGGASDNNELSASQRNNSSPGNDRVVFHTSVHHSKLLKNAENFSVNGLGGIGKGKDTVEGFGPFDLAKQEIVINKLKRLGAGQFGEVHQGICRGFAVAVKTLKNIHLDPNLVEGFKRECIIMRNLPHANILLFMGACLEPNYYYLVTELAPRGSLDSYLHHDDKKGDEDKSYKLTFLQKMKMAREIAQGMNWLHRQTPPILHLDLKPANLLLMEDWTVKIADFGMSRLQPKKEQESKGNVGGTPLYMPPEVFSLTPIMTDKCDVFAYAIILWEMVTEQYPYDKQFRSILDLQEAVRDRKQRPTIPDSFPKSMADLVRRCWDHEQVKRPSFSQVLIRTGEGDFDIFDKAVSEAIAGDRYKDLNGKVSQMWGKFTKGIEGQVASVPWDAFSKEFAALMQTKPNHLNMLALRAMLSVDDKDNKVTWENLKNFISTFGPLEPAGGVKTSTLDEVTKLVKEKWFWGEMSGDDAARVLQACKGGSFLVRFSANMVGTFTLSYRHHRENKVIHKRFDRPGMKWQQLSEEVKKEKKQLRLTRPAANRPPKFAVVAKSLETPPTVLPIGYIFVPEGGTTTPIVQPWNGEYVVN